MGLFFDTKDSSEKVEKKEEYDEYLYKPKTYDDVPKYKASENKKVDIVVDKNDFDYGQINPEFKTVDLVKKNLHEDLDDIVNSDPINESAKESSKSIYDDKIIDEINDNNDIEIIDIDDDANVAVTGVAEEKIDESQKLSIFGNTDEPIQAKVYDVQKTEAPVNRKLEEKEPSIIEKKEEVKFNDEGNKICPKCGAPLSPSAPVCFLCGYKF